MNKPTAIIFVLIIASLLAGVYGVLHDQVTYTVSNEYYSKFKFIQFGLTDWGMGENIGTLDSPEIALRSPRLGAAVVGFLATWWVGLIIGIVLGAIGLIHKDGKTLFRVSMIAALITIGIALIVGIAGLVYGKVVLANNPPNWILPENVIDRASFIAVGSMHNFSYLGGGIGMIIGAIYSIRIWAKNKTAFSRM